MSATIIDEKKEIVLLLEPARRMGELDTFVGVETVTEELVPWYRRLHVVVFTVVFVVPVFFAILYNFVIAADRYASTASYVVREAQTSKGVLSLIGKTGVTRSDDNSYAVAEYILSRDAVAQLDSDGTLKRVFGADGADMFSRFPSLISGNTKEGLYEHFRRFVDVEFKTSTGISTIEVQAFTPEDARLLTDKLLQAAEYLVNQLNERAQSDSVTFAQGMVETTTQQLQEIQRQLTDFRNKENVIDPGEEVTMVSRLMTATMGEIAKIDTQLTVLLSSTPQSPTIGQLQLRREALQQQLHERRLDLAGRDGSLSEKIEAFERISIKRELAEKTLLNAVVALASAQQASETSRIYLERIVEPNTPDRSSYPTRIFNVLLVAGVCFALFWIIRSMANLMMEEA